uniref:Uncharacterized protein n=1 Tax=Tanacetum cinerariifolium TaxID=118510 RepID=A0A699J9P6_TANCI|nr:hypothetical protein [Tanacetum cinerariifolium]
MIHLPTSRLEEVPHGCVSYCHCNNSRSNIGNRLLDTEPLSPHFLGNHGLAARGCVSYCHCNNSRSNIGNRLLDTDPLFPHFLGNHGLAARGLGKAAGGWHLEDVFTRSRSGSHDRRSSPHSQEDE